MNKRISAEDYLTLVKAGYTPEEISKLGGEPEETPVEVEEQTETNPEPVNESPVESAGPDLTEITNEIKSLKDMFRNYFIQHDSFEQTKTDIANQILANVINPVREKKG